MRKRIISQNVKEFSPAHQGWLDLEYLAQVEITSEDPTHPIESALVPRTGSGWRAAHPGKQTVRLLFDEPLRIRRVRLLFHEEERQRTQEFVVRWSADAGQTYREMVRQQYTFSPPATTTELEDYVVDLSGVTAVELSIVPDISGGNAHASLTQFQLE